MIIQCINCNKKFNVNSDLIPEAGRNIQCGSCNHVWFFKINQINDDIDINENKDTLSNIEEKDVEKKEIKEKKIKVKKDLEIVKYKKESNLSISKLFSYLIVLIISLLTLAIIVDTFKSPLIDLFPDLEIIIFNFYEIIQDINLFIRDLF